MSGLILSPIGLVLAAALSVGNVCADIARKKVMEHHELVAGTFWIRAFAALVFTLALAIRTLTGTSPVIRNSGFLFGISGLSIAPLAAFLIYLAIDVALISLAQILLMRALQVSPMSLCIPFMAFTPVFLIPMGYLVVGELPASIKLLGVCLIVIGSLIMHRPMFATGWSAPIRAIVKEKGSRYILLVAFILSVTTLADFLGVPMGMVENRTRILTDGHGSGELLLPPQGLPPAATKDLPTSSRESIRGNRCGSVSDCFLKKATWANKPTLTSYAQSDYWRSHG